MPLNRSFLEFARFHGIDELIKVESDGFAGCDVDAGTSHSVTVLSTFFSHLTNSPAPVT